MTGSYLTACASGPVEIKEKGSRFIGYLNPVASQEEAEQILAALRKEHYNATHVCFAWRLGNGEETQFRYSDDGEPSGTAGIPIYQEIKRDNLFNILCAVVRYYGGVKLGTGGLARAYGEAARQVTEQALKKEITIMTSCVCEATFDLLGLVHHCLSLVPGASITDEQYDEKGVIFTISLPVEKAAFFIDTVSEKSAGKIIPR